MVAPAIVLGLRGVQVVFSIIVLGLTAYLVDRYNGPYGWNWSPHSVNFMLFTSVWTLLAVAYLVLTPTRFPRAAHKFAIGAVEFLTMLFWFAAFVAVAVRWGDSWWGYGGKGTFYGCGVAAIVFSAFLWLTFVATTVLAALHIRRTPRNDNSPPPDMAGV
ncbi:marvel domain-containing protein [Paraphoma chrysanthemicola]|uniref:Marvel domain-containing protein n=1 Tax=Paraphoma chrysanthemicola TaxID=798071 RepID=A0A8K0R7X1_9PLEO|nr:marvel domain-containing protein [Paraphoma chrysanthemicola]KAH7088730.1 marvel domain-containing protein [Paraphoma chrysanthemicola]